MKIEKSVIDRISTLKDLPSLPHILVKLMEACHNENTGLGEIADILKNDPALCTKVLRLVNSAYYGLGSRIEGIDQAVAYLGTHTVKNIAVCSAVYQAFDTNRKNVAFNLKVFWWHSLKCALLSRIMAGEMGYSSSDEAFVAGLLHDIGKLVLWVNFSETFNELKGKHTDRRRLLAAVEAQFGATHSQIGAWLLDRWKFQSFVVDSALYHHEPLERIKDAFPLARIVYAADKLSGETAQGRAEGVGTAESLCGFTREQVNAFSATSDDELGEVARSFGIEIEAPGEIDQYQTDKDHETQENLIREVRDVSLLLGTVRNLVAARDKKDILKVLQEGLQILFDIWYIHFFLYDAEKGVLIGKKIDGDKGFSKSGDMIITMETERSLLVSCLVRGVGVDTFSCEQSPSLAIADEQVIRSLGTEGMLCLPLAAQGEYVGAVAVGLDRVKLSSLDEHSKLLELFLSEAALALRVEQFKEMQLRKIQSERARASFAIARKVVHEVNNPLGIMKNYLKILGTKLKNRGIEQDEIRILNEEINRVSHLLGGLTAFSETKSQKLVPVDINALINELIKLTGESLMKERQVAVKADLDPALPRLTSSKDRLKQIFINLMHNASEAMEEGGILSFKTRYHGVPSEDGKNRGFAEITVSDNGKGISDEMKKRLFEPFVSSKGGNHSGLGLSIVLNLITSLKGRIVCESEEGKGSRFKIELPVVK